MIKFKKVLSMAALSALFVGGLASCGQNNQEVAEQAAKTVIVQEDKAKISSSFKVPNSTLFKYVTLQPTFSIIIFT